MTTPAPQKLQLYDHLLSFQLFQGMSRTELLQMAGNTKFGFQKEPAGRLMAEEGGTCTRLLFLVSGTVMLTTRSADGGYVFKEQAEAPWLLQPEMLFGAQPHYTCSCITLTPCHFITLSKDEVLRLTDDFLIIRLNMFNQLSTLAQRRNQHYWRPTPLQLRQRFVSFLLRHSSYPAGSKVLYITINRLAQELGDKRWNVSAMLKELKSEHLAQTGRARITILSLEKLLQV